MNLNKYIEHTLLKQDATKVEVIKLLDEAIKNSFLGVCVNPVNVKLASEYLKETDIKVVTVVGFPLGQTTTESKVLETIDAIKNGADEIDMVLNSGKLKDGEFDYIVEEISKIKKACQGKALKVILETDLLTKEEIKTASELCMKGGADFVKTSTGFVKNGVGAKVEDVAIMKANISDDMFVKASGGIKTLENVESLVAAGAGRIGASSGIDIITEYNKKGE